MLTRLAKSPLASLTQNRPTYQLNILRALGTTQLLGSTAMVGRTITPSVGSHTRHLRTRRPTQTPLTLIDSSFVVRSLHHFLD